MNECFEVPQSGQGLALASFAFDSTLTHRPSVWETSVPLQVNAFLHVRFNQGKQITFLCWFDFVQEYGTSMDKNSKRILHVHQFCTLRLFLPNVAYLVNTYFRCSSFYQALHRDRGVFLKLPPMYIHTENTSEPINCS